MGLLGLLKNKLSRSDVTILSAVDAINLFKSKPLECFTHRQESYKWPGVCATTGVIEAFFPNICVKVHDYHIADIEYITIDNSTAKILHVGVAREFTGRGIGSILLRSLAKELSRRYGVNSIIFSENHSEYHERGYEKFYSKIGARRLIARHDQTLDRPDYEWLQRDW